jgi:Resolvase, N terminal domain
VGVTIRRTIAPEVAMLKSPDPVPAAQYLRMSTDMQECSIENQAVVIQRYAEANEFKIVKTYEDAGKSGLTIRGVRDSAA